MKVEHSNYSDWEAEGKIFKAGNRRIFKASFIVRKS